MTKEFKRTFFSSSIAVLLIITNLIGLKYTNFANFVFTLLRPYHFGGLAVTSGTGM